MNYAFDVAKMLDEAEAKSASTQRNALAERLKALGMKWKGSRLTMTVPVVPSGVSVAVAEAQKAGLRCDLKLDVCLRTLNMIVNVSL